MHRTGNFLSHSATRELSLRGYLVLAMNPRFDNNEAAVRWEETALDVRSGVEYLRSQPGIEQVVLFGHSGGGPTMSFYQAVAETEATYCRGAEKLVSCDERLSSLPPSDALVPERECRPVGQLHGWNRSLYEQQFHTLRTTQHLSAPARDRRRCALLSA